MQAHAALKPASGSLETLLQVLEPIKEDLQSLISVPPKNQAHRTKLASKQLEINGEELKLNDVFINDAAKVSDELSLDEFAASQLVFFATGDSRRLKVPTTESAITMFYARRAIIIDILRFCIETLPINHFNEIFPKECEKNSRLMHILQALKSVEAQMGQLNEKVKANEFIGFSNSTNLQQYTKISRAFLIKEHEALGNLLASFLSAVPEGNKEVFTEFMNHLGSFEHFDQRALVYLPALIAWASAEATPTFSDAVCAYFGVNGSAKWKLPFWQNTVSLIFNTFMAMEDRELPASASFADVLNSARRAIDGGALETVLVLSLELYSMRGDLHFQKYAPLVQYKVPKLSLWQPSLSETSFEMLQQAFEQLIQEFIMNLADILKEMRLSEEDMYLALNEQQANDPSSMPLSPGVDLERFLLLVASVFRDHNTTQFFNDDGNALYGFLVWGMDCQITSIAAVFAEMLACLATDEESCKGVYNLLLAPRNNAALNWTYIHSMFNEYFRSVSLSQVGPAALMSQSHVGAGASTGAGASAGASTGASTGTDITANPATTNPSTAAGASSLSTTASADLALTRQIDSVGTQREDINVYSQNQPMEITEDVLLVIGAYLYLIARVAKHNNETKELLRGKQGTGAPASAVAASSSASSPSTSSTSGASNSPKDMVPLLFKLLKLQQPIVSPVFCALSSLASADMWPMLNNLVLGRFDIVLLSSGDILSFLELVDSLAPFEADPAKFKQYICFIFEHVFTWAVETSQQQTSSLDIQVKCLAYLNKLLAAGRTVTDPQVNDTNSNMVAVSACRIALRTCFQPKVYKALFQAFRVSSDEIDGLSETHPLVEAIIISVQICVQLLELTTGQFGDYEGFDKPILYNLQVVPQISMYAGSKYSALSLASLKLLSLLDESPEFKPSISRQSRILSIISSSSEASKVRVGLISLLSDIQIPTENKKLLLSMLLAELQHSDVPKQYMSVAHYLLGFRQSEMGLQLKLELDNSVGGIETGTSLLKVVCDMLVYYLQAPALDASSVTLLRLCTDIVGYLAKSPLTSKLLFTYLLPSNYFLETLKLEPLQAPAVGVEEFYEHRAIMLEVWKLEIQTCQKKLLLTVGNHYVNALVPIIFHLFDLEHVSPNSQIALRCLQAWCDLVAVLIDTGSPKTGITFLSRAIEILVAKLPVYGYSNTNFARPVARLLSQMFEKYQERGVDYSLIRTSLAIFQASLLTVQPASMNEYLRSELYVLCTQYLRIVLNYNNTEISQLAQQELKVSGDGVLQLLVEDVFNKSNETLSANALVMLQLVLKLSRKLDSPLLMEKLIKWNFIGCLIDQQIAPALQVRRAVNEPKFKEEITDNSDRLKTPTDVEINTFLVIALSLLMSVSQTRNGALEVVRSTFVSAADRSLDRLPGNVLLLVLETLTTMLISLGPDYEEFLVPLRSLIKSNRNLIEDIFEREAATAASLNQQDTKLAKCVTILVSLTRINV